MHPNSAWLLWRGAFAGMQSPSILFGVRSISLAELRKAASRSGLTYLP
jgi:hypothetical protein